MSPISPDDSTSFTFVARGGSPYTVAFGSAVAGLAERPAALLLRDIGSEQDQGLVVAARASPVFTLGGEERRKAPPPPFPWKTWLLWAVLISGVALLALMVRKLWRQLGTPADQGGSGD